MIEYKKYSRGSAMKTSTLMKILRFYPPFLGAGISVKDFKEDLSYVLVQMKLHFWNKNYVSTHFGGSLYSMVDPFYMLMLIKNLGPNYIVWDKAANIRYKKPAKGTVFARFELTAEQINEIKKQLETNQVIEPVFKVTITDSNDQIVAEVEKTLHIKHKM